MESFEQATAYAKEVEKSALGHLPFSGKVEITRVLDLYPDTVQALTFDDLLNRYERVQKVIQASRMDIFGKAAAARIAEPREFEAKREQAETKMKALTTQAVEQLEQELAPPPPPPAIPLSRPSHAESELLFEKSEEEKEEQELLPALPIVPPREAEEKKAPPSFERVAPSTVPAEKPAAPVPAPPPLEAGLAAEQKYREIEEHFEREWGGKIDEDSIKKKMLELTKQLFKERVTSQRERIKTEIAVLKNMLSEAGKKGAAKVSKDYASPIAATVGATQQQELVALKDALVSSYQRRVAAAKKKFYDQLGTLSEDDASGRKKLYETLLFELTQLMETSPQQIAERVHFLVQKHQSELGKLQENVTDKRTLQQTAGKAAQLDAQYTREFAELEDMLKKNIENLTERIGQEILQGPSAPAEEATQMTTQIIFEINQTDEGTLLYYLHSKKPELYKQYERRHISKHEALFYAKAFMAKERGVSNELIKKHLGSMEGENA